MLNDGYHSYVYDAENRIIQVDSGDTATYTYDAEGRRVRKVAGSAVDYVYDHAGHELAEVNTSGSWNREEVYVGGRHLATYSGTTTYFHNADWLGTERVRTDVNGNIYETCQGLPYGDGQACVGTEVTPMHLTGKHRDTETNLDDFPARYYSSVQGRWLSPDWDDKPVAVPYAILGNPQTLNLYSYVGGDPTNHADPDGHIFLCPTCATNADSSSEAQNQGSGQPGDKPQSTHTITVTEVQGQSGNPANHVVVSVDGRPQVGFGPAKDLTRAQVVKEGTLVDSVGTPGKVEPRASGVKTLDQVTVHVSAEQAAKAQAFIDQRTSNPGNYHLTQRNCSEFGEDTLKAGGVAAPTAAVPLQMMFELHLGQSLGAIPQ
jgi:RHS repeat-associated protein